MNEELNRIIKECEDTETYLIQKGTEQEDLVTKTYCFERAKIYGSLASKLRLLRRTEV